MSLRHIEFIIYGKGILQKLKVSGLKQELTIAIKQDIFHEIKSHIASLRRRQANIQQVKSVGFFRIPDSDGMFYKNLSRIFETVNAYSRSIGALMTRNSGSIPSVSFTALTVAPVKWRRQITPHSEAEPKWFFRAAADRTTFQQWLPIICIRRKPQTSH